MSKSIVDVTKHVNFGLYSRYSTEVIWKNGLLTTNMCKHKVQPFIHQAIWVSKTMCLAEKNSCVMFIKFNLIKFINNKFLNLHKKTWSRLRQKKMYFCLFLFNCVFPLEHVFMRSAENQISSRKCLLDLI